MLASSSTPYFAKRAPVLMRVSRTGLSGVCRANVTFPVEAEVDGVSIVCFIWELVAGNV